MSYIAMSPDDERQDVEKARSILIKLTPTTGDPELIKSALRYVSRLLADPTAQGFSSDAALNNLRADASIALNHVTGSLESSSLTQNIIDKATRAVDALLKGFDQQNG
jgi:hypothetical protein